MANTFSALNLPSTVLAELSQRLIDSHFKDADSHVDWLAAHGFSISRSAMHRYMSSARLGILLDNEEDKGGLSRIEVRLRCLEVATVQISDASPAELTEYADDLLKWICRP